MKYYIGKIKSLFIGYDNVEVFKYVKAKADISARKIVQLNDDNTIEEVNNPYLPKQVLYTHTPLNKNDHAWLFYRYEQKQFNKFNRWLKKFFGED